MVSAGYQRYATATKIEVKKKDNEMKIFIKMLVLGMVSLWSGLATMAQPAVGDSYSGATVNDTSTKPSRALASNGGGGFVGGIVNVDVVPVYGEPLNPGKWLKQAVTIEDWRQDLRQWVRVITGPVEWYRLVFAESNGIPVSTNPIVQILIDATSIAGDDTINIGMFSATSKDRATGSLSHTFTVGNKSYSAAAIGIKKDGTVITGGPNDQMVARIIFVIQPRLYSGGATWEGKAEVRSWILIQSEYIVDYEVFVQDREVLGGKASISVRKPYLSITRESLTLNGEHPEFWDDILYSQTITGPWRVYNSVNGGKNTQISATGPAMFYKVTVR